MPEVSCAIAAYTGWNLRAKEIGGSPYLLGNTGSYIPFSISKIQKKFPDEAAYVDCVEASALALSKRGMLLPRDIPSIKDAAGQHWRWRMPMEFTGVVIRSESTAQQAQ